MAAVAASTVIPCSVAEDIARRSQAAASGTSEALEAGLRLLSILPQRACLALYRDITGWVPGGAETYISVFEIEYVTDSRRHKRKIIAKAVIALGGIVEKAHQWIARSDRLNQHGVMTPRNYAFWQGTFFQQFIQHDFAEYFQRSGVDTKERLARQLLGLARNVSAAGFSPISLISDLRTDGNDLYVVDVGSDLGHFGALTQECNSAYSQAHEWLKSRMETFDEQFG